MAPGDATGDSDIDLLVDLLPGGGNDLVRAAGVADILQAIQHCQDYEPYLRSDEFAASGLKTKAQHLLEVLAQDRFATPPKYEKLVGDLAGCYSRRINIQHRLVYEVLPDPHVVHILRMWTHYE